MAHKLSLYIMPMAKPAEMTERAKMMMAHKVSLYMILATTGPMVKQAEMAVVLEQVVAIYNIGDNKGGGAVSDNRLMLHNGNGRWGPVISNGEAVGISTRALDPPQAMAGSSQITNSDAT